MSIRWMTLVCMAFLAFCGLWASLRWFVKQQHVRSVASCRQNLRAIDGAKQAWALEHHVPGGAFPTWDDLVGQSKALHEVPLCPNGGVYSLGPVSEPPTCSFPEHGIVDTVSERSEPARNGAMKTN